MIRQTATGMEQQCRRCVTQGNPEPETWWPLTDEFFRTRHPSRSRVVQYETICKVCRLERDRERRQAQRAAL